MSEKCINHPFTPIDVQGEVVYFFNATSLPPTIKGGGEVLLISQLFVNNFVKLLFSLEKF
jgi:hypothetical protein